MTKLKYKKPLLITIASAVLLVVVVVLFISPITKYLIEKYDEKYCGRQITMDWVYVNPFTGYIHFSDLKIYENKSDSVFFSTKGMSATFSMLILLTKNYEISEIDLNEPKGTIIQHKRTLNFDDLIKLFSPRKSDTIRSPVHFSILRIKINNGEFYFRENEIPINYFIKEVNFESTGFQWNADTIGGKLSFLAGKGNGNVKGDFTINYKTLDYRFAAIAQKFDLEIIDQYLKALVNYGTFRATVDADLKATGNFKDQEDITAEGIAIVNDFHFGKDSSEDYASFDRLKLGIDQLSPKYHKYLFDSVWLSHPYFKYERYDHLDNLETMFGEKGANISAAKADPEKFNLVIEMLRYTKVLVKNFFRSSYKINKLAIVNGNLKFNDFSLSEKFTASLAPLYINADSVDKTRKRVRIFLKSGLLPYGNSSINLSINPNDSSDFDLDYHFQKIPATLFNPYLVSYTSFPLDRGTIELNGSWNVRSGSIQSVNHLLVIDPRLSHRIKNKDLKWIPMPLLMAFIRERGNVIDYEIPISGNLKNPKFHIIDAITDLVKNIFIKPVTIPYAIVVTTTENEIEKSLNLKWEMQNASFEPDQEKFIERIAKFLKKNPDASLSIYPISYAEKEKEQILFFESKRKYFLLKNGGSVLSEKDSITIDKMSVKDPAFVEFLDRHVNSKMLFTIQQKCYAFIKPGIVNIRFDQLNKRRENTFRSYFIKNGTEGQLQIHTNENSIPYDGFSYYKINYKGDIPEALISAYESLNEMNSGVFRKKYRKERKKDSQVSEHLSK